MQFLFNRKGLDPASSLWRMLAYGRNSMFTRDIFSRKSAWILAAVLILVFTVAGATAQTIDLIPNPSTLNLCWTGSRLSSGVRTCGVEGYQYVFIGSVLSTEKAADGDTRLVIRVEEVFAGKVDRDSTSITSQGSCLPEIKPGERWLFYLRRNQKNSNPIMEFAGPSRPMSNAQEQIARLRRLAKTTHSGIVEGTVVRPVQGDLEDAKQETYVPAPNRKIVAKATADGAEHVTFTDKDGHFEFELDSGSYDLRTETERGPENYPANVDPGSCLNIAF